MNRLSDVESQLALLHKKLAHLERAHIVTADESKKFELEESIAETRREIAVKEAERAELTAEMPKPSASLTEPKPAAPPRDARKRGWKLAVAGAIVLAVVVVMMFVAIWRIGGKESPRPPARPPGRMLVRTVVDGETLSPVEGACVRLRDVVPRVETKTDAAGKFQLEYPPGEDESRVEIEKDGYCPVDEYVSLRDPDKPFELRRATRGCGR
jgi:hypothetical protein